MAIVDPFQEVSPEITDPFKSGIQKATEGSQEKTAAKEFSERNEIAFQLGVTPIDVDTTTGADFLDRLDFSFSDNDAEIIKKFRSKHPNGVIRRVVIPEKTGEGTGLQGKRKIITKPAEAKLVFKLDATDEGEKYKTIEDYGKTSLGDIADIGGPLAKTAPAVGLSILAGPGAIPQALATGVGMFTGHMAKEGVEELRGFQLQPFKEVLGEAGMEAGTGAAFAGGLGLARNALNVGAGRGLLNISPEDRLVQTQVGRSGLGLRPLHAAQLGPEHKLLQRFARQSKATGSTFEREMRLQEMSAVESMRGLETRTAATIVRPLSKITESEYRKRYFSLIKDDFVSPEKGGKALQTGVKDFVAGSRKVVTKAYSLADDAASAEKPVFDFAPSLDKINDIEKAVRASLPEQVAPYGQHIPGTSGGPKMMSGGTMDVSGTPAGQLLNVIQDIKKIAPQQNNYEVVKQLRTRLYDMIDNQPWNWDFNKFQARELYSTLTDVLRNPANSAPNFVKALGIASQAARDRFDILSKPTLQKIVKTDQPAKLAIQFGQPGNMTEEVFSAIKQFAPQKLKQFQRASQLQMLQSPGGALKAVNNWLTKDPDGFSRIVPTADRKILLQTARNIDMLNSERAISVFNKQTRASQYIDDLLKKQDPSGIDEVIKSVGGKGSKGDEMLRAGAMQNAITRVVEDGNRGYPVVNPKKLKAIIHEYKQSGVWEKILTKEDKLKLNALEGYTRLLKVGDDVGTSQEAARILTKLKHPTSFLTGIHGVTVNALLAKFLISPKATNLLVGSGRKQINLNTIRRIGVVVGTVIDDIEAGEQKPSEIIE